MRQSNTFPFEEGRFAENAVGIGKIHHDVTSNFRISTD